MGVLALEALAGEPAAMHGAPRLHGDRTVITLNGRCPLRLTAVHEAGRTRRMWSLTLPRDHQLVLRSERHIVISCEMMVEDAILV